ncbi:MAG: hypothetical protein ACYSRP_05375, partial [Planctomycetota bacterium]
FGVSESENFLLDKLEFPLGKIEAGATKSYSNEIEIPKSALDRNDEFIIKFTELNGNIPKDIHGNLVTEAQKRPQFAYSYQITESDSDGSALNDDGLIQKGERINLLVTVKNVGEGKSTKNVLTLRELSDKEVFVEEGSQELGELAPGESKTATLRFHVRDTVESNEFTMDLMITDLTFGTYLTNKLTFPILESKDSPSLVNVSKELLVMRDKTPVYGGRSVDSPIMTLLDEGSVFTADSWVPGWYRVELSNGGHGWVTARDVAETDASSPGAVKPVLYVQHAPPVIDVERPSSPSHTLRTVISGDVWDVDGIKHLYVLVNTDKVYLNIPKDAKNIKNLHFKAEIPLKEGPNTVTIVARDTSGLLATKSFVTNGKTALVKGSSEE